MKFFLNHFQQKFWMCSIYMYHMSGAFYCCYFLLLNSNHKFAFWFKVSVSTILILIKTSCLFSNNNILICQPLCFPSPIPVCFSGSYCSSEQVHSSRKEIAWGANTFFYELVQLRKKVKNTKNSMVTSSKSTSIHRNTVYGIRSFCRSWFPSL